MTSDQSATENPLLVPPRSTVVTLYPGDVEQQLRDLYDELDEAVVAERGQRRMGVKSPADELAERIEALKVEARAGERHLHLIDPGTTELLELQDECPPREGNARDEAVGLNTVRYYQLALRKALVDPVVTDEQYEEFLATVGTFNWGKVVSALDSITSRDVDIPKSSAVSVLAQLRGNDSTQPNDTE